MLDLATRPGTTLTPVPLPDAAFLFADIAGFTAFTEQHGDAAAASLAWRLRLGVERQLGHDAHVVKTLGDAVMVRVGDPAEAVEVGLRIVACALGPDDPPVRVGVHYGPAVECDGDFFGSAVNVAARVASLATPGEVLLTEAVARAAGPRGLALEPLGERALRNVADPVLLLIAREASETARGGDSRRLRRTARRPRAAWTIAPTMSPAHVQL
jgi:class 3 adenylate cyclase